jgi:DNA-binding NtrC family response regulator
MAEGKRLTLKKINTEREKKMVEELKAKVLLVDDEEDFLSTLSERLVVRGLKVTAVTRGEDAVAKIDEQTYDLIVLDLAMPGIGGLEAMKRIKMKQPDAEIIILSGQGSIKTSIEAMKLGAEDFLQKPVDMADLLQKISDAKEKRITIMQAKSAEEIEKILKSKGW